MKFIQKTTIPDFLRRKETLMGIALFAILMVFMSEPSNANFSAPVVTKIKALVTEMIKIGKAICFGGLACCVIAAGATAFGGNAMKYVKAGGIIMIVGVLLTSFGTLAQWMGVA